MIQNHRVVTPCGEIQGMESKEKGISVFKGIRYATAERWKHPKQITHYEGIYDATQFGNCSYQPRSFYNEEDVPEKAFYYNEFRKGETYTYSEDCLFLNIWAPDNADNAPVLFYIHGGGFKGGCGHEKHFSGEELCKRGLVVVTINYRLGPLGFCSLPELAEEETYTGNYGLYDQLCALRWVRDNIEAFGGNKGKITIMGQSAGAMSVQQLSISPLARGLFAGAVMLSGGGVFKALSAKPVEQAYPFWNKVKERLGATTIEELRNVDVVRLFEVFNALCKEEKNVMGYIGPVIDGNIITKTAVEVANLGEHANVPYLMGSTSEDMMPPFLYSMARNWAQLQAEQGKKDSYMYFFSRQLPGDTNGAWHSSDLWYMFGTLANGWRPFTEWDYELSGYMMDYLANFVKTGNPNGQNLPVWLPNKKGQNKVMRFTDKSVEMGKANQFKLYYTMFTNKAVGE